MSMVQVMLAGANDDLSSIAASEALPALVGLLLVSAGATWWIGRRPRRVERPRLMWFAGLASLTLLVAVTLFRQGVPTEFRLGGLSHWSSGGLRLLARDPLGSSQFFLNIVLFVPAGMVWTWILRRPLAVLLALVGASLVIESIQAVTRVGAPDIADLVANSIGAAIGVSVAAIVNSALAPNQGRLTLRSRLCIASVTVVVVVLAVVGVFVGASQHQQSVEDALRAAFEGTDRSSIEARLGADPGAVFGAVADYADGTRRSDAALEIRYPAAFLGLRRCVFVVWTSGSVDFRKASGHDCTEFIDR